MIQNKETFIEENAFGKDICKMFNILSREQ